MTLAPGTRLGPYEILAPLGAGGMGEVWRARDTRLGREVAVKVLPPAFAHDEALRARFEREAKTISSLNHAHICTLFDVGREGDTDYLVLELVEGETLLARVARGPLPTAELLRYGMQIADALERAHRAGIVHRDLKPGNIMLTKGGTKLLDFGLARGGPPGGDAAGAHTISPTMTGPLTKEGHIVGTFQYMAPEQLEGAEADPRSDLWALGCVLHEMATAKPAFHGGSQASLISSIMKDEPAPFAELAPMSPPALERAIRQCLAKDPEERWQTAGDLKRELAWISTSGSQASAMAPAAARARVPLARRLRAWALPLAVGAAIVGLSWFTLGRGAAPAPAQLALIHPGPGVVSIDPVDIAISPDGSTVAYVELDSTGAGLWVRRLDQGASKLLVRDPGLIRTPFWSPDSRHLAYMTTGEEGKLWKVPAAGGAPVALAPATNGRGGAWSRDGVIVFAPAASGPLLRVRSGGGEVTTATVLDSTARQSAHRVPQFLPDGDHFLYSALPQVKGGVEIHVGSLRSGKSERLTRLPQGGATYAEPGYLLFARAGKLVSQAFDANSRKISGEPFVVADDVGWSSTGGGGIVSASRNGRLAWLPSLIKDSKLSWVDRTGTLLGKVETPGGMFAGLAVGPDGWRFLATRYRASGEVEVFHHDPERGSMQRVSPVGVESYMAIWSPGGESFVMRSNPEGRDELYRQSLTHGGAPERIPTTDHQYKGPRGFLPDGETIYFIALGKDTDWDLWATNPSAGGRPVPILDDPAEVDGLPSPNGRLLAVVSNASGKRELFLAPIDRPRNQRRVSAEFGEVFEWRADGRELFFDVYDGDELVLRAIPVDPVTGATTGPTQTLLRRRAPLAWSVAPGGQRILISVRDVTGPPREIRIALDWTRLPRPK